MSAPVVAAGGTSIAGAVMASWAAATMFWMSIGAGIWKLFIEPREKDLKKQLSDEQARCAKDIDVLRDRVKQLETLLIAHGPAPVRRELQAALSERQADPAATD